MLNDKQLFEKNVKLLEHKIDYKQSFMTLGEFEQALKERDKQRVCESCNLFGRCDIKRKFNVTYCSLFRINVNLKSKEGV